MDSYCFWRLFSNISSNKMGQQRRLQTEKQEPNTNRPLGDSKDLDSLIKRKKIC